MLGVVPREEDSKVSPGVLGFGEAARVVGCIFYGLEVAFRVRVVVGYARPTVAGQDVEIHQKLRKGLGCHWGTTVLVERKLTGLDTLLLAGGADQLLGQCGALSGSHHPRHDVAREEIQHDVEGKVAHFRGPGRRVMSQVQTWLGEVAISWGGSR